MACRFYSSAFGPAGLQAHILSPPEKKKVKISKWNLFAHKIEEILITAVVSFKTLFPLLSCEVNEKAFSWFKRENFIILYYFIIHYTINHKSANNISNIYLLPCTAVELYGVIAYLSQNASKNRKWILSLYTVLTLLLSFPNFGLLSLGLGLYFYLFLLMDVGVTDNRFLVTFGLDCLILNHTYRQQ